MSDLVGTKEEEVHNLSKMMVHGVCRQFGQVEVWFVESFGWSSTSDNVIEHF